VIFTEASEIELPSNKRTAMAKDELFYNGILLEWAGHGKWKATSGVGDYQKPEHQAKKDKGPIPAGLYDVPLILGGAAVPSGHLNFTVHYKPSLTIQEMPTDFYVPGNPTPFVQDTAWGCHRVGLKIIQFDDPEKCGHRSGFYIHDSQKGYSKGCIETEKEFFEQLIPFAQQQRRSGGVAALKLRVNYAGQTTTNGGTYVKP
jgi:hypothetical protein